MREFHSFIHSALKPWHCHQSIWPLSTWRGVHRYGMVDDDEGREIIGVRMIESVTRSFGVIVRGGGYPPPRVSVTFIRQRPAKWNCEFDRWPWPEPGGESILLLYIIVLRIFIGGERVNIWGGSTILYIQRIGWVLEKHYDSEMVLLWLNGAICLLPFSYLIAHL